MHNPLLEKVPKTILLHNIERLCLINKPKKIVFKELLIQKWNYNDLGICKFNLKKIIVLFDCRNLS